MLGRAGSLKFKIDGLLNRRASETSRQHLVNSIIVQKCRSLCLSNCNARFHICVGDGGALVESFTFNRRVVGSTPALAVT